MVKSGKESICQYRRCRRLRFDPWVGKVPWGRAWQATPLFLPGESHGWRSLAGYSLWGPKESDMVEWAHMHEYQGACVFQRKLQVLISFPLNSLTHSSLTACVRAQSLSRVQLFATPWTVAYQATLSMGFPRQESWSGLPFPSPDPGIKLVSPASPALPGGFLTTEPPGKPALMNASL